MRFIQIFAAVVVWACPAAVLAGSQPIILEPAGGLDLPRIEVLSSRPDQLDIEFSLPAL